MKNSATLIRLEYTCCRQTLRGSCRSGVKNFDTLWQYRKAGQTAQYNTYWQVGRPSKFFRINLDAQSKFMSAEATPRKVRRLPLEAKKFISSFHLILPEDRAGRIGGLGRLLYWDFLPCLF